MGSAVGVTLMAASLGGAIFTFAVGQVVDRVGYAPVFWTAGSLAMIVAGMIFIALMAFRALGGQFSSRQPDGIAAAAVFWYASCAVYAVVWVAVYIMK